MRTHRVLELLAVFTRLGLTSFGGPIAHFGYYRKEFVERRQWLDDHAFADLTALCQFLPGPASSQFGIALGWMRGGLPGSLAAWVGFTLPSAVIMTAFAYGITNFAGPAAAPWLHGLKLAAVAVVAQAVWSMAKNLCPDARRAAIAAAAAVATLLWQAATGQILVIAAAGLLGRFFLADGPDTQTGELNAGVPRRLGIACIAAFFIILAGLPFLRLATDNHAAALFDAFYRSGSLVFGGGHVILPFMKSLVVQPGWVTVDNFTAGYGAAQAIPGPLFTFAAYLGAVGEIAPRGLEGAAIALFAIFTPAWLLITGVLPFWETLRTRRWAKGALMGVNASVVGLLLTALYDPIWTSAVHSRVDFAVALGAFFLLEHIKLQPVLVVALCAVAGGIAVFP